jgi:hypothetical protein
MSVLDQAANHVGAHPAQSDHAELHCGFRFHDRFLG